MDDDTLMAIAFSLIDVSDTAANDNDLKPSQTAAAKERDLEAVEGPRHDDSSASDDLNETQMKAVFALLETTGCEYDEAQQLLQVAGIASSRHMLYAFGLLGTFSRNSIGMLTWQSAHSGSMDQHQKPSLLYRNNKNEQRNWPPAV